MKTQSKKMIQVLIVHLYIFFPVIFFSNILNAQDFERASAEMVSSSLTTTVPTRPATLSGGLYTINVYCGSVRLNAAAKKTFGKPSDCKLNLCSGKSSQKWQLQYVGEGLYTIKKAGTNLCLAAGKSVKNTGNGTGLQLQTCKRSKNQKWNILCLPGDAYAILAAGSNFSLVANTGKRYDYKDGGKLQLWNFYGDNGQKWAIKKINSPAPIAMNNTSQPKPFLKQTE